MPEKTLSRSEQTKIGLAKAKANGVRIGRPPKKKRRGPYRTGQKELTLPTIVELHKQGVSKKEIARRVGTDRRNVSRWLQQVHE